MDRHLFRAFSLLETVLWGTFPTYSSDIHTLPLSAPLPWLSPKLTKAQFLVYHALLLALASNPDTLSQTTDFPCNAARHHPADTCQHKKARTTRVQGRTLGRVALELRGTRSTVVNGEEVPSQCDPYNLIRAVVSVSVT